MAKRSKNVNVEDMLWVVDDWTRSHVSELQRYLGEQVLVHPVLGVIVHDSDSINFKHKRGAVRKRFAEVCKVILVDDMLLRRADHLNTRLASLKGKHDTQLVV